MKGIFRSRKERKKTLQPGQSILEYILLLGVVIGVLVTVLFGGLKGKIESAYNGAGDALQNGVSKLQTVFQ